MDQIKLMAILHRVSIDKEGESKITLTVPMSDRFQVMALSALTEKILKVSVECEE